MRPVWIAVSLACAGVSAQTIVDPARLGRVLQSFEPRPGERALRCEVEPIRPLLNFSFRFQAGYSVRVPMSQYFGTGHRWIILTRITPDGGDHRPVYLGGNLRLPDIPKTNRVFEIGGAYLLGEGGYSVNWLMLDDAGRVCRKRWHIDARLGRGERSVKTALPSDTVREFSGVDPSAARRSASDRGPLRLTVLLHAASLFPRRTKLRAGDRILLLGSLVSLLERLPAHSVRLVVFNLDQQKELFRADDFSPEALDRVAQSLDDLELGLVDYRVLQNSRGPIDLLTELVNQELRAKTRSDVVVFLGPPARYLDKLPKTALEQPAASSPQFFYFEYKPNLRGASGPELPDSISSAISLLRGKTLVIHSPGEFAKAIEQVERRSAAVN